MHVDFTAWPHTHTHIYTHTHTHAPDIVIVRCCSQLTYTAHCQPRKPYEHYPLLKFVSTWYVLYDSLCIMLLYASWYFLKYNFYSACVLVDVKRLECESSLDDQGYVPLKHMLELMWVHHDKYFFIVLQPIKTYVQCCCSAKWPREGQLRRISA